MILLHAHVHIQSLPRVDRQLWVEIVTYYVLKKKIHQNPLSGLGGHAPTRHGQKERQADRRKNRETDKLIPTYPQTCLRKGEGHTNI